VVLPFGPGTEGGGAAQLSAIGTWTAWLLLCALVNAAVLGALLTRSATPPAPERTAPAHPARIRTLLTPAVDNWPARAYLAVVAASLLFFLGAAYVSPDPGFAGIWPLITTAPLSILALLVPTPTEPSPLAWLSPLVFAAGSALSGMANAVLLGRLAHRLRGREAHPAT
jgi:hypothetical protein